MKKYRFQIVMLVLIAHCAANVLVASSSSSSSSTGVNKIKTMPYGQLRFTLQGLQEPAKLASLITQTSEILSTKEAKTAIINECDRRKKMEYHDLKDSLLIPSHSSLIDIIAGENLQDLPSVVLYTMFHAVTNRKILDSYLRALLQAFPTSQSQKKAAAKIIKECEMRNTKKRTLSQLSFANSTSISTSSSSNASVDNDAIMDAANGLIALSQQTSKRPKITHSTSTSNLPNTSV